MKSLVLPFNHERWPLNLALQYREKSDCLIFCIHGLGCAKEAFAGIWHRAELSDFSIMIPDLVGFGESVKPSDFPYSMEAQARVCRLLADTFAGSDIIIVAHSMGAVIGLLLAELIADRLQSFVMIEGNLIPQDCALVSSRTINYSFEDFKREGFNKLRSEIASSVKPGAQLWLEWTKKADCLAFYKSAQSLVKWSASNRLLPRFSQLPVGKVYFYGQENEDMDILQLMPDIKKIAISQSGHFVMNDNPAEFYPELAAFIRSVL
ncbi:alpha/beta fold hydrolase [candidate division CSSED10-310 bacterium]|uniref:Alpha/beta fold hydrolase n=1 Tax=candidate division CSSED10-310 bacterium TaxID=2855610 RepID=A0ABV6YUX5_UNCC1